MAAELLNERDLAFYLYEMLDAQALTEREPFRDHDRESFDAAIETARKIAEQHFLPIRGQCDQFQPVFRDGRAEVLPAIGPAIRAYIDAGLLASTQPFESGGMQLPQTVAAVLDAYPSAANMAAFGYTYLTKAAADLIQEHGSEEQRRLWLAPMYSGRFFGTMALTEPDAGSGLADLTTTAVPRDDGSYRLKGNKIFISGGDHELADNIVHMVLARVKGAPRGTRGISLFICPKFLPDDSGEPAARNDLALTGLFHKMGGRGQTSTSLSFGDNDNCVAWLVGEENQGLRYMFHMMNEARIGVGTGAVVLGYAGYRYSLDYARQRPQGRLPSSKDPLSPPVNIVEHADVRRMLLAQKAYVEAGMAMSLYGRRLLDDRATHPDPARRERADRLLDLLTPIFKSWPSKWCLQANYYAIQVLGGHGYINEHPVEQFYRDNRLNPIHEGTHGIQSLDLLARKVMMNNGANVKCLLEEYEGTIGAARSVPALAAFADDLAQAVEAVQRATGKVMESAAAGDVDRAFANSAKYMDAFGHVFAAWLWLWQAQIAAARLDEDLHADEENFYRGKLMACRYFYRYELPHAAVWAGINESLEPTCHEMRNEWF